MSVKIVIPSRYGSTRLEGKLILENNGLPMVCHVVERCKEAGVPLSDITVAKDDKRIFERLDNYNINVVMTSTFMVLTQNV